MKQKELKEFLKLFNESSMFVSLHVSLTLNQTKNDFIRSVWQSSNMTFIYIVGPKTKENLIQVKRTIKKPGSSNILFCFLSLSHM
jgi:hypothetical protein